MTQQPIWAATLAPIDRAGSTGMIITSDCVITVRPGAALVARSEPGHRVLRRVGQVTGASVIDGYLVAVGTLAPGFDVPTTLPTFDSGYSDLRTFNPADSDGPYVGTTTFHTLEINRVCAGFGPTWPDAEIRFSRTWCIHLLGPDDLIPMPDYATADRSATRFNTFWEGYVAQRPADGVDFAGAPAIVRPWPYADDEHAAALDELRADDPEGWLSA